MTPDRPGLVRDEVTAAGYAVLATWAWFLYGFGAILPLIRTEEQISRSVLGLHSLALAAGAAVAGAAILPLVRRIRRRGCFVLGAGLVVAGIVLLVAVHGAALTVSAVLIAGVGGSMLVNSSVAALTDHHGPAAATAMSEGNGLAAAVGLVAPAAVGGCVALGWSWRPAALVTVPMALFLVLIVARVPAGTAAVDGTRGAPEQPGPLPAVARLLLLVVVLCVGMEFCCTAWSADLLRQRTGLTPGAASAGVSAVVAGMAAGRLVIGRLALRWPARRLLLGALLLTAVGWLATWIPASPGLVLAGLAITGLGIAGHFPLAASLAYAAAPGQADRATSRMSLGIAAASGLAPFVLGTLADATSTHTAFVIVPILVAAALVALGATAREQRLESAR